MHGYTTDLSPRIRVFFVLALLSVVVTVACQPLITRIPTEWSGLVPIPTSWGVFLLLFLGFDRYLWKMRLVRWMFGLRVPNLSGVWSGSLYSSYDEQAVEHPVTVTVDQDWTRISIVLETDTSRSVSVSAAITERVADPTSFSYEYRNEPKRSRAPETMEMHYGSASLLIRSDDCLEGEYYSDPGRGEHGHFAVERQ